MDKQITLRFFKLTRTADSKPTFESLLTMIGKKTLADRERTLAASGIMARLENYDGKGAELSGQLMRAQSGNRPGRMMKTETAALPFSEPLGHGIAFRYRKKDSLLGLQFDTRVLSPSRFLEYFYAFDVTAEYRMTPIMRDDAWDRFNAMPLRKLSFTVAGHPADGTDANASSKAAWAAMASLRDEYEPHMLTIEMSMGHRDGQLAADAKKLAKDIFDRVLKGKEDVRSLRAVMDTGDGNKNDDLDLMGTLFDVKEDLSFNEDDQKKYYSLRHDILKNAISKL